MGLNNKMRLWDYYLKYCKRNPTLTAGGFQDTNIKQNISWNLQLHTFTIKLNDGEPFNNIFLILFITYTLSDKNYYPECNLGGGEKSIL